MNFNSTSCSADAFRTFGFGVLRQFFDPHPLAAEIDQVMHDGLVADVSRTGEIRFQYVPMMTPKLPGRTPRAWSRWYGSPGPARTRRRDRTRRPDPPR